MAADLLSAVGEVVVRPRTEDLWKRHTTPRWGIRVEDVSTLPEGLIMKMQKEGGEVEDIFQPVEYPDLPTRCRLCGSIKHLQQGCTRAALWRAAVMGRTQDAAAAAEVLPGAGGPPRRPLLTPTTNQANNKAVLQKLTGGGGVSDIAVIKVGMILLRSTYEGDEIWMPTQQRRTTFPLWNVKGVLKAEDEEAEIWAKVEERIRDIVMCDFPEETRATARLLEKTMAKVLILHNGLEDTTVAYFVGYVRVRPGFDQQPQRQGSWIPKEEVMEVVRDGTPIRGAFPSSMKVIAAALRGPLFENEVVSITVPGSVKCIPKPQRNATAAAENDPKPFQVFVTPPRRFRQTAKVPQSQGGGGRPDEGQSSTLSSQTKKLNQVEGNK